MSIYPKVECTIKIDMLRRIGRNRFIYIGTLLHQDKKEEESHIVSKDIKTEQGVMSESNRNSSFTMFQDFFKKQYQDIGYSDTYNRLKKKLHTYHTGWDRLKDFVRLSEHKDVNPSMQFVIHSANSGFYLGFIYGGYREYNKAVNLFLHTNDTTKFANVRNANSELARKATIGFLKGAVLTGPKAALLVTCFTFIHSAIAEFRGKCGIIEFPIAGGFTVAMMKWNLGIRGMISGFCSGFLTGLILGPILHVILKIGGYTISDMKYITYSIRKEKEELELKRDRGKQPAISEIETIHYMKTEHLPSGFSSDE